jgi:HEPN domain-containing protein
LLTGRRRRSGCWRERAEVIPNAELVRIAKTRLGDAKVLLNNGRHDGAGYLCGYAVEVALKYRVCQFRNWEGQPENAHEDPSYRVLITHALDDLLHLANIPRAVRARCFAEWSIIRTWSPTTRYDTIGSVSRGQAERLIQAAERLVKVLVP